jgi:hypothetical protein
MIGIVVCDAVGERGGKRTSGAVRAANLAGAGVEAVHLVVAGRARLVAGTAGGRAGRADAAHLGRGLVAGSIIAADDAEERASGHLDHDSRLVGPQGLGGNAGGQAQGREGSDGLDEHCDCGSVLFGFVWFGFSSSRAREERVGYRDELRKGLKN